MDDSFDPLRIALTVLSGRNFQGRKKGDQCHASVVFGLGKELYQTETVQSNDPYWNQEAHVNVTGKSNDSLVFKIKDQGHTVGVVKIPIKTITRRKHEEWYSIKPNKKDKDFHGEIRLSCFVSEFQSTHTAETTPTDSTDDTVIRKGILHNNNDNPLLVPLSVKNDTVVSTGPLDVCSLLSDEDNSLVPEVTGISPNEGSIEGNERVVLRGTNLGENRDDIVKVTIVNIDCTSTLEYYSSGKLVITTLPRKLPGKGPVIIETVSGGVGISSLHYSFVVINNNNEKPRSLTDNTITSIIPKARLSDQEIIEMQSDNRFMKQQIKELKETNRSFHDDNIAMKEYIEQLLSTIIEHNPELLEIAQNKKRQNSSSNIIDKLLIT